jgi:Methyltransferase domain
VPRVKQPRGRAAPDPLADPDVPPGMSLALLQELHLLTRDGQLNQDARRKLKQIRHFVGLLKPALDDVYTRHPDADAPVIVDCGAGKSYLGFLLYELIVGPRGRGQLCAVEVRAELQAAAAERARRFGHERFAFAIGAIGQTREPQATAAATDAASPAAEVPARVHVVAALHACDTATDDAIALGVRHQADYIAVVPCCQAEVARQLKDADGAELDAVTRNLFRHPLHRREFGSHLTNVVRGLALQAHGYQVTVTELVGWEHSAKNELLLARRIARFDQRAADELRQLCARFGVEPALVRQLPLPAAAHGVA